MTDVGKVGIQLWFPLTGLKVVVFDKGQLECFADFCQIEDKSSIVVMWTIVWNSKKIFTKLYKVLAHYNIILKCLLCNFLNFETHEWTLYVNKSTWLPKMLKSTLKDDILCDNHWEVIAVDSLK